MAARVDACYVRVQPTKFMVGTENGSSHVCSRKAKTPSERVATSFQTHYGPVYAIQRHPTYPKHFLTIGDWSAKVRYTFCMIVQGLHSFPTLLRTAKHFCPRYETRSSTVPEIADRTVCLFNGLFACSDTFLPYGVQYNSYRLLSIRGTVKNVLQFDITHKINDTSKICILLFNIITLNSKTFMKMFFDASQIEFLLHALQVCLISLSSL